MSSDPDTLSNRVVHMSVQLFSNESLALKMVEELSLLHVMIISLKQMMSKILIQNTLHGERLIFTKKIKRIFHIYFFQIPLKISIMSLTVQSAS